MSQRRLQRKNRHHQNQYTESFVHFLYTCAYYAGSPDEIVYFNRVFTPNV